VCADDVRRYKFLIIHGLALILSCLSACYLVAIINSEEENTLNKKQFGFQRRHEMSIVSRLPAESAV
jgi:hypothetical protein